MKKKSINKLNFLVLLSTLLFTQSVFAGDTCVDGSTIEVTDCTALAGYGVPEFLISNTCSETTYTCQSNSFSPNGDFMKEISYRGGMCQVGMDGRVNDVSITDLDSCVAIVAGGFGIKSSIPSDDGLHVALDTDITLEFSEAPLKGTGTITLHDALDNSTVESFDVTTSSVSITDVNVSITRSVTLSKNKEYYLNIPATAFKTVADENIFYEGISDSATLSFKTNYIPTIETLADVTLAKNGTAYILNINESDADEDLMTLTMSNTNDDIATFELISRGQIGSDIDGEAVYDSSGTSVSLSSDGTVVAIGAVYNDVNGNDSGHVRVYKNVSGIWTKVGDNIDGEAASDFSGTSVSLSSDGNVVAIGATGNDGKGTSSGHVRIYKNVSDVWTKIGEDIDGEAEKDYSGMSVSLSSDGNVVAISATGNDGNGTSSGHVRIYKNVSDVWTKIGDNINGEAEYDSSGTSVSLSSDGNVVAIGADNNDDNGLDSGHVRIYKNVSNVWTKIGEDIDGETAKDSSGYSVSLSSDGTIVAIGAYRNDGNGVDSGHVRIYKNVSDVWTKIGDDIDGEASDDSSGYSVSLSSDGTIVAIGARNNDGNGVDSGHVRIYKNVSDVWTKIGDDINGEAANDSSGNSVSLSSDGTFIAIGAYSNDGNGLNSGHVRIHRIQSYLKITPKADAEGQGTITISANDGIDSVNKSFTLTVGDPRPIIDLDADNSSGMSGVDFKTTFTQGDGSVSVSDSDVNVTTFVQ